MNISLLSFQWGVFVGRGGGGVTQKLLPWPGLELGTSHNHWILDLVLQLQTTSTLKGLLFQEWGPYVLEIQTGLLSALQRPSGEAEMSCNQLLKTHIDDIINRKPDASLFDADQTRDVLSWAYRDTAGLELYISSYPHLGTLRSVQGLPRRRVLLWKEGPEIRCGFCVQSMKGSAFSIAIVGSTDTGLNKMNPVTVRLFDLHDDKVVSTTCVLQTFHSERDLYHLDESPFSST